MRRRAPKKPKLIFVSNCRLSMPDVAKPSSWKLHEKGDEIEGFVIVQRGNKWLAYPCTQSFSAFYLSISHSVSSLTISFFAGTVALLCACARLSLALLIAICALEIARALWGWKSIGICCLWWQERERHISSRKVEGREATNSLKHSPKAILLTKLLQL